MGVPHRLAVVMGVDVDEARRDRQAVGIDLLAAARRHLADFGDLAVLDRDVAAEGRSTVAIHDGAAAYDDVEFAGHVRDLSLVGLSVTPGGVIAKYAAASHSGSAGRFHSACAKTCSRFAKNRCHPPCAPCWACC